MKRVHRQGLAIALLAVAMAACSTTSPTHQSVSGYFDDSATTARIKGKYVGDKQVSALDIGVETYNGNVQLSGYADNREEIQRAADLARTTPGVKSVHNDIHLKTQ